jgi:KDO2-lipid IV(A) lauroyltransferase
MNDQENVIKKPSGYQPNIVGRLCLSILVRLPVSILAFLGRGFGYLFYVVDVRRTRHARVNLEICFPELTAKDRKKLLVKHFKHLGQSLFCTLGITWHNPKQRLVEFVHIRNLEILDQALANKSPVIILAPHFAGLELAFARLAITYHMAGMYRPPRKNILHWAIDHKRRQFGSIPIESNSNLKKLIRIIREGTPFYYLPDLDQGRHTQSVYASFFNHPAATVTALNRIALLTRAKVIPCITSSRGASGHYDVTFLPALENFPSKDMVADATVMNELIEKYVRKAPDEYFWVHRRFKTQDEGGQGSGRDLYK